MAVAGEGFTGLLRLLATILLILANISFRVSHSSSDADADALLRFKSSLHEPDKALADWVAGANPCAGGSRSNWTGVICDEGQVFGLQLEYMKLSGTLNLVLLADLPGLRTLSLMGNDLEGQIAGLRKLGALRSIYLSSNKLSGEIPDDEFSSMNSLRKIYLSNNKFSGRIPKSFAGVTRLVELRLDGNEFSGELPDLRQHGLRVANVSGNQLEGRIPDGLQRMDKRFFAGNKGLCGAPLDVECNSTHVAAPPPPPPSSSKLFSPTTITIAVIALCLIMAFLALIVAKLRRTPPEEAQLGRSSPAEQQKKPAAAPEPSDADTLEKGSSHYSSSSTQVKAPKEVEHGKLVFVRETKERFQLQDLLKASAEVLGSGNFGASYKAVLGSGFAVVVKRYREMNRIGREDFQEHMRRLGRLSHPNLLPLMAYHYRKEEKLLMTEYLPKGSLAHLLHGTQGPNRPPLDWALRLKLIKGVAKGLLYLYEELPMLALPHGHLKSSNVLLTDSFDPCLTDYALAPVVNKSHASHVMIAYKSPEFTHSGETSKKSDVWSLGVLILEVLTGKFPANYLHGGAAEEDSADLVGWVHSVPKEQWEHEVFDAEIRGQSECEEEMLKMLEIGLGCCEKDEEKRWEMKEAVKKIEDLRSTPETT